MEHLDNVTLRRPLKKCKSLENIDMSISINSSDSDEFPSRRLDTSTHITALCRDEMTSEISSLRCDLQSTQHELENVILENMELKKLVAQLSQEIEILKQICRSPVTSLRQSSAKKLSAKRRLTDSFRNPPVLTKSLLDPQEPQPHSETQNDNAKPEIWPKDKCIAETQSLEKNVIKHDNNKNTETSLATSSQIKCPTVPRNQSSINQSSENTDVTKMARSPKIFIIGDQQVRGFASEMKLQRDEHKWNNIYKVTGISKPYASSTQITSSIDNYINTLQSDDIVILGIGNNDKNPYIFLSELISVLHKLRNIQVYVLNIINNPYLNVNLLNTHIKLFLQNYPNCKYIDTTENIYGPDYYNNSMPKKFICYKINIEIDNINLKKIMNSSIHRSNKSSIHRKGTIPYYFAKQKKNTNPVALLNTDEVVDKNKSTFFRN